jgi:hypothetical protein
MAEKAALPKYLDSKPNTRKKICSTVATSPENVKKKSKKVYIKEQNGLFGIIPLRP